MPSLQLGRNKLRKVPEVLPPKESLWGPWCPFGSSGVPFCSPGRQKESLEVSKGPSLWHHGNSDICMCFTMFSEVKVVQMAPLGHTLAHGGHFGSKWAPTWLQVALWNAIVWPKVPQSELEVPLFRGKGGSRWVKITELTHLELSSLPRHSLW